MTILKSVSIRQPSTLRAVRWFTITHGVAMGAFVVLVGSFLWAAHLIVPAQPDRLSGALFEHPLEAAVVGLAVAIFITLLLLGRHAQHRLAAELERDRLFTLSPDPLCILGPDGALERGNPAFERFFSPDGASTSLIDRAHPDDRELVAASIAEVAGSTQAVASFEARFLPAPLKPAGDAAHTEWRWMQWSIRKDARAHPRLLHAVGHDTTERRNAEAALAAESAFRQAMEDSILTGMRAFDLQGRITYVNRAFCQLVDFTEAELVGSIPPYPYWPSGDEETHRAYLEQVLAGNAPTSGIEVQVQRRDGALLDVRMYVSPLIDRSGRHTGWMTSVADITEPKRIREALASAHERFTTVLEELDASVSVLSLAQAPATESPELLFANRMYRLLFGTTGIGHDTLLRASTEAASNEVFHVGLNRWFELRSREIRWVDGRPVQMLVATDITARRETEEHARQQQLKLQQTSRLVTMGEMASSLAHELNQPLTAIGNYCMGLSARIRHAQSASRNIDPEALIEALDKTAAQAERAAEVIRRIRNFVKRSQPERRLCTVNDIVDEAIGLVEFDAKRHRLRIVTDMGRELPVLNVDPILIQQVLVNLLKNAIEATREASGSTSRQQVQLRVRAQGGKVLFEVIDRGTGLSEQARQRLFEPFFTTKSEGMGIGLNICRSIVESHEGRLWLEPGDTGGLRARFELPAAALEHAAQAA
jgi:hypothetical protein